MKEYEIYVGKGKTCPYCGNKSYDRKEVSSIDDTVSYDCTCNKCGKIFNETTVSERETAFILKPSGLARRAKLE